ncbi:hypothetical protein B0H21DRAFT_741445 [Amylocystis lapponica]|nr:hypothetical protein B0H21DRAFT_741445 [Amylocystis lapponica]
MDLDSDTARPRQTSVSSSVSSRTASSSRPVSPSDSTTTDPRPMPNFSLVRTTFDKANALIVVGPLAALDASSRSPSPTTSPADRSRRGQAFLLIGPAMEQLRHPQRRLAKGARVHPYRIVPGRTARRTSSSSTSSDIPMDA